MYFSDLAKKFEIRNYKMFPMQENAIDELIKTYGKLPNYKDVCRRISC